MSASISTGPAGPEGVGGHEGGPVGRLDVVLGHLHPAVVAIALFGLGLVVYIGSNIDRTDFYDHFVWQADAFLAGRAEIDWPVTEGRFQNGYFQDVLPAVEIGRAHV